MSSDATFPDASNLALAGGECVMDDLAMFAAIADMMVNRADAERWAAGLTRRAVSIATLMFMICTAVIQSRRSRASGSLDRVYRPIQWRHLVSPPARWAAA